MTIVCISRRDSSIIAVLTTGTVDGASPVFPTQILQENTAVTFGIKTRWTTINGSLEGFSGVVSLDESAGTKIPHGQIVFPLDRIRTNTLAANRSLHSLCQSLHHPRARFTILGIDGIDHIEHLGVGDSMPVQIDGVLTIRAVSQMVWIFGTVRRTPCHVCFSGDGSFDWREFGIALPKRYLLSGVSPLVSIHVETSLPVYGNQISFEDNDNASTDHWAST
jgi:polyisoprenoid-binding protein YceI